MTTPFLNPIDFLTSSDFLSSMFLWLPSLLIWSTFWKGLSLWKAARHHQKNWFIFLLLINTAGLFEILYLSFFQKKSKPQSK